MGWMDDCTPTRYTGIWKTPGGYRVRVRAVDPKTGRLRERNEKFEDLSLEQAVVKQAEMKLEIQRGGSELGQERVRFGDYSESLYKRKLAKGEITSARNKRNWADVGDLHLSYFNDWFVDAIRKTDIEEWLAKQALLVAKGDYSPNTVNGWLRILKTILRSAVQDLELPRDPTVGVRPLDTSEHHTYTEEEPNSLTIEELPVFMAKAKLLYPQHYAMLALGFSTGRRPSELRPLRRCGATPDILWDRGILLVRRGETMGEVRDTTKTNRRLQIPLPVELVEILREHATGLPEGPMRESELLFPSETGGYRSASCLDKPFRAIAKEAGIKKHITPRSMRRTFQDLGRQAEVHDSVVRAISGHATVEMQQHYSSVAGEEVRAGLGKVIELAGIRQAKAEQKKVVSGDAGGDAPKAATDDNSKAATG